MVFEKLEKRVILKGTIKALTPLRIGTGRATVELEHPVIKDVLGTPYIPGSSLKGRIRSEFERIAKSLGKPVCEAPLVGNMCGSRTKDEEELCAACKVFGTAGRLFARASKVTCRDAYPTSEVRQTEIRESVAIERETKRAAPGRLFSVEAVPRGTTFDLEIIFENPEDEELKLFLAALKSVEDLGVGGHTSRGYGKVEIRIHKMIERSARYYLGEEGEKIIEGKDLERIVGKLAG